MCLHCSLHVVTHVVELTGFAAPGIPGSHDIQEPVWWIRLVIQAFLQLYVSPTKALGLV